MLWPTPADYAQAVGGFPDVSLLDSKLRGGRPKTDSTIGLLVYSGGFSTVFPIEVATDVYALRCWTRDIGGAKNRYEKISAHLKRVRLPYFVDFKYVPEGILINGKRYPITRMEWSEGELLRDFIDQNLQNATIFRTVADEFRKMVADLHTHRISHGDLQNGNILVKKDGTDVEIKLIDYDSLFVPDLHGQPSPTPGLPEYQHPARGSLSNEKVDYFSELVIYLSFLSLSEKPDLWTQFGDTKRVGDGLLFSKQDFENPDQSDVFQELTNLSPDVQQLAATLKNFCAKTSVDELEPLEDILPKSDASTHCNQGESFLNDQRYDEALEEFQKAIDLDPNYERARYGIGRVYLHSERYTDAINAFEQLISSNPNYKEAHHGLGLAYLKAGENNRAMAAVNAALRIDPGYQPARELLDAIKSVTPPPIPPTPPPKSSSSGSTPNPGPPRQGRVSPTPNTKTIWQPITDVCQKIIRVLESNQHFITAGTLSLALIICFVAFLIQIDAKNAALSQRTELTKRLIEKESESHQQQLENQGLTSSVQTLKGTNQTLENTNQRLKRDNGELRNKLENRILVTNTDSENVINLRRQLNEQKDENQNLQNQLTKKDAEIRQLRNDKTVALSEKRKLQRRLVEDKQDTANQDATVQQLRTEKLELQNQNQNLIRQNQRLWDEKKALQNQLNDAKIDVARKELDNGQPVDITRPEPPRHIDVYRDNATLASVRNNHYGITAFILKDYNKAVTYFKQAIQADLNLAITHYNLGCVYLEIREYGRAISAFGKAVAINHEFEEAYYNLGLAHLGKGAREQAKSSAELALRIDKNYQRAQNLLAILEKAQ